MEGQVTALDALGTSAEVAAYLRKSPKTLRNWRRLGRGPQPWHKTGREVLYRWSDVQTWLEQQRRGGEAA